MRQLQKGPTPNVLAANEDRWTADYVEARKNRVKTPPEHWGESHRHVRSLCF